MNTLWQCMYAHTFSFLIMLGQPYCKQTYHDNTLITGSVPTDAGPTDSTPPLTDTDSTPLLTTDLPVQFLTTDEPGLPSTLMPTTSNSVSMTTSEETLTDSEQSETTVTMSRPSPVESNLVAVVGGAVGGLVIVNVVVVAVAICAIMVFHKFRKGQ